ncbi:hypothetical protein PC110_g18206 [Phytophthora cactorum]|uniref:Crinkler effector protein N-terminal domain-containing protein n=2 Tax=Phytophthora cactorum TaxID=29920 RepID=A0A329RM03_9STRA|nr:hypothetical protein PC110_g18206 [Phytophthora cactorum]
MVQLFCAIVGEAGSAFSVRVDESDSVDDLKDAIKEKNLDDPTLKNVAAKNLQLFLAKKDDGAWLTDDEALDAMLQTGVDTSLYEKMRGSWRLNKPKLFGPGVSLGEDVIHVLVVVPEGAGGSASETSATNKMIEEIYAQTVLTKRTFSHSQGTPVDPFEWARIVHAGQEITPSEEQQRKPYLEYVKRNIDAVLTKKKLCVIGVEKNQHVLNVKVPERSIQFGVSAGSGDADRREEKIEHRNNFQALSELVALDLRANGPVMALLTDLNKYWIFFWVAEKKSNSVLIHRAFIDNPGEGFEVIKTLLEQSSADIDAGIEIPYFDHPVKRLKLKSILSTVIESGESGGIRESIQRYYDIASMLGPDLDMARVVASQVTRAIPAYSYYS